MSENSTNLRQALGQFPTGVCVITCKAEGGDLLGMTMSSFNTLSLDPPLVLFSIDRRANSLPLWEAADGYAVNVLSESQQEISNRFARPLSDKWCGIDFRTGYAGAPLLLGASAVFECARFARHDAGDHVLFIAEVKRFASDGDRRPLIFAQGKYGALQDSHDGVPLWPLNIHY
ncbi:flavin reductase family protein [Roseovarius sp. Pro17]|uniref:flavin reductase family protein n=1 Tax=Roseovarius sp. Pro17 TaxID=3108175 RepID=UPI002D783291|nr:flavin reductase family protein [Roseovarius sp. Pro17]